MKSVCNLFRIGIEFLRLVLSFHKKTLDGEKCLLLTSYIEEITSRLIPVDVNTEPNWP
jgi:hypothetical protein